MTNMQGRATLAATLAVAFMGWLTPSAVAASPDRDTQPGTVVAVDILPQQLSLPGVAQATKVTYWSQGPHDQPMLSSGAVFLPEGSTPEGGWPVVSWAHGTKGVADECAPTATVPTERDSNYLRHWLDQGYAVVATDYVGLGTPGVHPYLDGRSAAHSAIDMVRAARSLEPSLSEKWVVIGQSQGGHAAMFTGNLASEYAPELDYRGAVETGTPSQIEKLLPILGPGFPELPLSGTTAYMAYILDGLRAARPELDVNSYLSPLGTSILDQIEKLCVTEAYDLFADIPLGQLVSRSVNEPAIIDAAREIFGVPTSGYDRPIFMAQGQQDKDQPAALTAALVAELSANRVGFQFRTYPTDHSGTMAASLPDSTPFVAKLFAGQPVTVGSIGS
ncbi:lipase family protein [Rhodococcus sp. BH2-1]|nr:lipase family protein [Rhodococcus sp. BH2-1]